MQYTLQINPALASGFVSLNANWCYQAVNEQGLVCTRFGKPIPACKPGIAENAKAQGLQWIREQADRQAK